MTAKTVIMEKHENIAVLTMNNPDTLNALSGETVSELNNFLDEIETDENIRVVIMTGTGKAFVAGADISFMQDMNPQEAEKFSANMHVMLNKIAYSKKVFIAALNGFTLGGGCELALACDIRVASEYAKLGLPEVSLGILPGGGGTQRITRLVGVAKAKELIFTGDIIKADEALKIGLVNKVVPKDDLISAAFEMANKIVKNAPLAVSYAKECLNIDGESATGFEFEKKVFGLCFATDDQKHGMKSFLNKETATFKGK